MFESIKRALGASGSGDVAELQQELERVQEGLLVRQAQLDDKRASRLTALYPQGPVEGAGNGRFPDLDPINFEEGEPQSWLVAAATGIIERFPGSATLLSQLDRTFRAFSDANHYQVVPGGPYAELLRWQEEIFACWGLEHSVPVFVAKGGGVRVVGCNAPFAIIDAGVFDPLPEQQQRFMLASCLGHVFFGNLKIFAFYRLFEMLDKLPSMAGLITRGLGMIPGVGNTISRGIELARTLNQQVIRKTNLVVGVRQHVLCDRLASLAQGGQDEAQRYLAGLALPAAAAGEPSVRARLIEQGRGLNERFEQGEVDLTMLSILGPDAAFAALRAFKLDQWTSDKRSQKLHQGYYVTRARLEEYRRSHKAIEEEISFLVSRILELSEKQSRLQAQLLEAQAKAEAENQTKGPASD